MSEPITRIAPSPTGALHLGNARTFLINWAMARQRGWRVVLRIEDLDSPRTKPDADRQAIEDLQWLGIDWDEGPHYQLRDLSPYQAALDRLGRDGLIYPCGCTRSDIVSALSAPHEAGEEGIRGELRYPGTCRPNERTPVRAPLGAESEHAWRVRVPPEPVCFDDGFAGPQRIDVQQTVGDFVVVSKQGLPAYQLAVVVDDARQQVTDIVRGDDLLSSAGRQALLYQLLDLGDAPRYYHLPLVKGEDGRRLAKRHGDTRVAHYREQGVEPDRLIGLIAEWCGLGERKEMSAGEFADRFHLDCMSRSPIVFTSADDRWLTGA